MGDVLFGELYFLKCCHSSLLDRSRVDLEGSLVLSVDYHAFLGSQAFVGVHMVHLIWGHALLRVTVFLNVDTPQLAGVPFAELSKRCLMEVVGKSFIFV